MSFCGRGCGLPAGLFFPGGGRPIYINFYDPWPSNKHARRRLTHENFFGAVPGVLRDGDRSTSRRTTGSCLSTPCSNSPKAGYELSEVTRDLHGNGVCGIMTDYEEKFHDLGTPINRCVGTKLHLEQESKFRPIAGP